MQTVLTDVLGRRKNRAIAIILGIKERECDVYLPEPAREKLRKTILDQLNEFHDLALDLMRSLDTSSDAVVNEVYLETLERALDVRLRPLMEALSDA